MFLCRRCCFYKDKSDVGNPAPSIFDWPCSEPAQESDRLPDPRNQAVSRRGPPASRVPEGRRYRCKTLPHSQKNWTMRGFRLRKKNENPGYKDVRQRRNTLSLEQLSVRCWATSKCRIQPLGRQSFVFSYLAAGLNCSGISSIIL